MDWIGQVDNLFAFLAVVVVAVVLGKPYLDKRRAEEPPVQGPGAMAASTNGTSDKVRVLINEACKDCRQVTDIKTEIAALRADFRGLEHNVATDIRGVHERLDRVIERRVGT
jgi:hypothetical protein